MSTGTGSRGLRWSAVLVAGCAVLSLAAASWLDAVAGPPHAHGVLDTAWNWATVGTVSLLGVRIVQGRPRHAVGWILVAMGLVGGMTALAEQWAYAGLVWRPGRFVGASAADVLSMASWLSAFAGLAYLVLYFPDGQLPSARWRHFPWMMGLAFTGAWLGATVQPGRQNDPFKAVRNPAGVAWFGGVGELVVGAFMLATLVCLILSVSSVVVRFKRASGEDRAQLEWLTFAVVLLPVALLGCVIGLAVTGDDVVGEVVLPLALVLIPGAIGLAVLRYRLYDVEYLINRTIVYATVSLVVSTVFVCLTMLVGVTVGRHSPWAIGAATVGAVVVARPARDLVQRAVNRRFDRAVADSLAVIDDFLAAVRDDRADPALIESTLAQALDDPQLRVWLWLQRLGTFSDVAGQTHSPPAVPAGRRLVPINKGDALIALIDSGDELAERPRLLRAVLQRSRLGLEVARLSAESASQMIEIEASRARILEATYEERRRLERDLHDGAQQRLVALGVRIRRLQRSMPSSAQILSPALDQTVDEISATITDLRRLAAGLRPARLDDGLAPALEDLARTTPVPIDLHVDPHRAPLSIEASAYFVACEGITNAVKHAHATRITVEARHVDGCLQVRVSDDGIGGATARPASGLTGLSDRVEAVGGRLVLTSPPGGGTSLTAELPCAQ